MLTIVLFWDYKPENVFSLRHFDVRLLPVGLWPYAYLLFFVLELYSQEHAIVLWT